MRNPSADFAATVLNILLTKKIAHMATLKVRIIMFRKKSCSSPGNWISYREVKYELCTIWQDKNV
jgi:hypothetical protein